MPLNPQAIEATLQSTVIAQTLPAQARGTPYLVVISLGLAHTTSGFAWALGSGPNSSIKDGALASVDILTGQRAPIRYVVPSH